MVKLRTSGGAKGIFGAVVAGGISALLFVLAFAHPMAKSTIANAYLIAIPLSLSPVPLFMAGLGAGMLSAVTASVIAAIGLLLTMPSNVSVWFAIAGIIPAILLTTLALRHRTGNDGMTNWYPESLLLAAASIYPIALFIGFDMLPTRNPEGLLGNTIDGFRHLASQLPSDLPFNMNQTINDNIVYVASITPSIIATCLIFLICLSFVIAQAVLVKTQLNIRPALELMNLRMPYWMAPAVGLGLVATILGSVQAAYVGKNISLILGVPFFCQGLAIVHAFAATTKNQLPLLIVFYIILSVLVWLAVLVALLGIADQWVDFRRRWNRAQLSV